MIYRKGIDDLYKLIDNNQESNFYLSALDNLLISQIPYTSHRLIK